MIIHFLCLCHLGLTAKLNFNMSKVAYWQFSSIKVDCKRTKIESTVHHLHLSKLVCSLPWQLKVVSQGHWVLDYASLWMKRYWLERVSWKFWEALFRYCGCNITKIVMYVYLSSYCVTCKHIYFIKQLSTRNNKIKLLDLICKPRNVFKLFILLSCGETLETRLTII